MKKWFAALFTAVMLAGTVMGSQAFAAEGKNTGKYNAEMMSAVNKQLKEEHSDFKNGSLEIRNTQLFEVSSEESDIKQVVAGTATYKTVRDNLFAFSHRDTVFYDPQNDKALTLQDVAVFPAVADYEEAQKDQNGKFMHVSVILMLLAFILIVPAFFMFFWEKRQYSTTEWTTANNIYGSRQVYH